MLAGIGGRTIAEAQERLSYTEFCRWLAYRRKRGSFNVGMRIEHGSALLATLYANSKSTKGGYRMTDFMPHQEEPPVSLETAKKTWT